MENVKNIFGSGILHDIYDVKGPIFCQCCACMSVSSDYLSWANTPVRYRSSQRITKNPSDAASIIVLGCQVTDLAILNDLRYLEKLIDQYPNATFFVGGCLAKRFDIPLPDNCHRINDIRTDHQPIWETDLLTYSPPFWVKDFSENLDDKSEGMLFRNSHPIRIGSGCINNCSYCTIKITRGKFSQIEPRFSEFLSHKDNVLIADGPTLQQLYEWSEFAMACGKPVSFRNVEPAVIASIFTGLGVNFIDRLIEKGLLNTLHCPIQSPNPEILKEMNRNVDSTLYFINEICPRLKEKGVYLATNIIIDYKLFINDIKYADNPYPDKLSVFDYVTWNPYWDGEWDIDRAKEKWNYYFPWDKI